MLSSSLTLEVCLQQALDIHPPWSVQKAELERSRQRLRIDLRHAGPLACPICGAAAKRHDARRRAWRHLDFFECQTVLTAEVPLSSSGRREMPAATATGSASAPRSCSYAAGWILARNPPFHAEPGRPRL